MTHITGSGIQNGCNIGPSGIGMLQCCRIRLQSRSDQSIGRTASGLVTQVRSCEVSLTSIVHEGWTRGKGADCGARCRMESRDVVEPLAMNGVD